MFIRTCAPNLLVEFECFSGRVPPHIEQYQVIHIGLPQKACCLKALGLMDLDAVGPQDSSARLARRLVTVDEENGLALKNWLATKWWWTIHTTLPKRERNWAGLSSRRVRESREIEKHVNRH